MTKEKFSTWNKSVPNYSKFQDVISKCIIKDNKEELKILELGSGEGGTVKALVRNIPKMNYLGLEKSKESSEKCNKNFNVKIKVVDFLKFKTDEKFDVIIAALSLHHFEKKDKEKMLKKIKYWLGKEGVFVWGDLIKLEDNQMNNEALKLFKDFREKSLNNEEKKKIRKHIKNEKHIFNTIKEMNQMLKLAGFSKFDLVWKYYKLAIIKAT